jgi:hypothetical protein
MKPILVVVIVATLLFVQVNLVKAENNISTDVHMTSGSNPTFVNQPVNFIISASGGSPPYRIQWYVDGATASGATEETFVFVKSTPGVYHISVTIYDSKGAGGEPFMLRSAGGIGVVVQEIPTLSPSPSSLPQGAANQSITFSSGVILYSPLNTTYNSNLVYCNGSFSCPNELLETLNYTLDEKYLGFLPWKIDMATFGGFINYFNGSVPLSNLSDGSHKLSIGIKEELWDGTHQVNETTWINTIYFTVNTNQSLPITTQNPTPSVSEFSILAIIPLMTALFLSAIMIKHKARKS